MELIDFQGLNCYHNCIVSIANYHGLDYSSAFSTLWSEMDFRYETYRRVYLTQRMLANLESLGQKLEMLLCSSPEEAEQNLFAVDNGEFIVVGMDAFYIPWNQFYQTFHGPHYFIAREGKSEEFLCFDPTYDKKYEKITRKAILPHAFDTSRMHRVTEKDLCWGITYEAEEVLRTLEDTRQKILLQIMNSVHEEQENIILLAKYIDAMISNRYLFRHYLRDKPLLTKESHLLFNRDYFLEWTAVKNGLYKVAISKNKDPAIQELHSCFDQLMDKETAIAQKILDD